MDLVAYLGVKLHGVEDGHLPPGLILKDLKGLSKNDASKYLIKGGRKIDKDKIIITELPIGSWTMNYLT